MKNSGGFTFIEMMIVMAILVVIAGLAVPNLYKGYQQILLRKSVEDMAFLMRYAQSQAVIQRVPYQVEFNGDLSKYWLARRDIKTGGDRKLESQRIRGRLGKDYKVPEEITVTSGVHAVAFNPDGTIEKVGFSVCLLKKCYLITTKEQSGYVQIINPVQ